MDGQELFTSNGTTLIDRLANHVDDSAERLGADGHHDGVASVLDGLATHKALGGVQGDRAHVVATQMLGDLEHETVLGALNFESIEDGGKLTLKLHINDGADDLGNFPVSRAETP